MSGTSPFPVDAGGPAPNKHPASLRQVQTAQLRAKRMFRHAFLSGDSNTAEVLDLESRASINIYFVLRFRQGRGTLTETNVA